MPTRAAVALPVLISKGYGGFVGVPESEHSVVVIAVLTTDFDNQIRLHGVLLSA